MDKKNVGKPGVVMLNEIEGQSIMLNEIEGKTTMLNEIGVNEWLC